MRCGLFTTILAIGILSGCTKLPVDPERDNQFDENNPDYIAPEAVFTSAPSEGEVLTQNSVTFFWQGQQSDSDFSYRLVGISDAWSSWSSPTSVTYNYLDEESYEFQVKERYISGDEQETPTSLSFTMNAVIGPALVMRRQFVNTNVNGSFTIDVITEDVNDLMGALIKIEFTPSLLELTSIEEGEFFSDSNPEGTAFFATLLGDANSIGWLEINASRLGGSPAGVDGTGIIAQITFRAKTAGNTNIVFSAGNNCTLRDSSNSAIQIVEFVDNATEIN